MGGDLIGLEVNDRKGLVDLHSNLLLVTVFTILKAFVGERGKRTG